MSLIADFISKVQGAYATGNATEHSYRSAFEALFTALDPENAALNEPKRVKNGAPDFIVPKGDNVVDKPAFTGGKVWINKTQYFANVLEISWGLYIGGYQPAQKRLKDRKGRALSFDDVKHYQRIIKILSETDRIMQTITMDLASSTVTTEGG